MKYVEITLLLPADDPSITQSDANNLLRAVKEHGFQGPMWIMPERVFTPYVSRAVARVVDKKFEPLSPEMRRRR